MNLLRLRPCAASGPEGIELLSIMDREYIMISRRGFLLSAAAQRRLPNLDHPLPIAFERDERSRIERDAQSRPGSPGETLGFGRWRLLPFAHDLGAARGAERSCPGALCKSRWVASSSRNRLTPSATAAERLPRYSRLRAHEAAKRAQPSQSRSLIAHRRSASSGSLPAVDAEATAQSARYAPDAFASSAAEAA